MGITILTFLIYALFSGPTESTFISFLPAWAASLLTKFLNLGFFSGSGRLGGRRFDLYFHWRVHPDQPAHLGTRLALCLESKCDPAGRNRFADLATRCHFYQTKVHSKNPGSHDFGWQIIREGFRTIRWKVKNALRKMVGAFLSSLLIITVASLPATTLPSHQWTSRTVSCPVSSLPVPHKRSAS